MTEPAIARRLRQLIMLLLCLWLALSLVKLFWTLYPSADITPPETLDVINPVSQIPTGAAPAPVDIAQL
ncbi:MAG: type II secretion system protein GspC, partial [Halieaceae bacterium]|nr:type II secretion system protein GspC [Halieaceae bacterium]